MLNVQEYGRALFELSEESGNTESIYKDVMLIRDIFKKNPEYTRLLDTPAITKDERARLIKEALGSVNEYLCNLVCILADQHISYLFGKVADTYSALYDESRGIERVEVVSAVSLTESQKATLIAKLARQTGKRIILSEKIDSSLLGGMKLRYSGIQLDGTVKARLDSIAKALSEAVV